MKRCFMFVMCIPLIAAGPVSDKQAATELLDKMIAGESLPQEILDRQNGDPKFPDLDRAIASVRGCRVGILDRITGLGYGVQWKCRGRKAKDQPSAMLIYVKKGQVTRVTTAILSSPY